MPVGGSCPEGNIEMCRVLERWPLRSFYMQAWTCQFSTLNSNMFPSSHASRKTRSRNVNVCLQVWQLLQGLLVLQHNFSVHQVLKHRSHTRGRVTLNGTCIGRVLREGARKQPINCDEHITWWLRGWHGRLVTTTFLYKRWTFTSMWCVATVIQELEERDIKTLRYIEIDGQIEGGRWKVSQGTETDRNSAENGPYNSIYKAL